VGSYKTVPCPSMRASGRYSYLFFEHAVLGISSIMALPPKWYQFLVSVFASLGSLLYGYDLGVIAEAIACQSFKTKFNPNDNEV